MTRTSGRCWMISGAGSLADSITRSNILRLVYAKQGNDRVDRVRDGIPKEVHPCPLSRSPLARGESLLLSRSRLNCQLVEEFLDQHSGGGVQEALSHGRDGAAHLHVAVEMYAGSCARWRQRQQSLALHEADLA